MKTITRLLSTLIFALWAGQASAVPITGADIVTVDGTDWAQVDLFTNLSWNDIDAVCSGGACTAGSTLNGYDMTDWVWASTDDMNAFFNFYIGSIELGPIGADVYGETGSAWAPAFFADGWRANLIVNASDELIQAWTSTEVDASSGRLASLIDRSNLTFADDANTAANAIKTTNSPAIGGWFYRSESAEAPAPATLALFGIGLAGLGWSRRNKS